MVTILLLIHGAYPFFTHTQLVGKLGWLEYVFVTPSHHRVHHSSNEEYLDKNYGDVLIIWDKLFGTFAKETTRPVYGLTKPLSSHSFLWQHFHYLLELIVAVKITHGLGNKLKLIFGRPDMIDPRIRTYLEKKLSNKNENIAPTKALTNLIKIQTVFIIVTLFISILFSKYISYGEMLFITMFIIISLVTTGAMLEQRTWIFPLELLRLTVIGFFCCEHFPSLFMDISVGLVILLVLLFYKTLHQYYFDRLYKLA